MTSSTDTFDISDEARVIFDTLLMGECSVQHVNPAHTHVWIDLMSLWLDGSPGKPRVVWVTPPRHAFHDEDIHVYKDRARTLRAEMKEFSVQHVLEGLHHLGSYLRRAAFAEQAVMDRAGWLRAALRNYPIDSAVQLLDALLVAEVAHQQTGQGDALGMSPQELYPVADRLEWAYFTHIMVYQPAIESTPGHVGLMQRELLTVEGEHYRGLEVHDSRAVTFLWGWHDYDAPFLAAPLRHKGEEPPHAPVLEFWRREEDLARQAVQVVRETLGRELRGRYQGDEQ